MSGGGQTSQTSTQRSDPWAQQAPYLVEGYERAADWMRRPPEIYPGSRIADRNPMITQTNQDIYNRGVAGNAAMNMLPGVAGTLMGGFPTEMRNAAQTMFQGGHEAWNRGLGAMDAGLGQFNRGAAGMLGAGELQNIANDRAQGAGFDTLRATARGDYLTQNNPFFQQMVEQSIQAGRPQMDAAFAGAGRGGSGAHAAAFADYATRTAGQLGYQDYARERAAQEQAAGALSGLQAQASQGLLGSDISARGLGTSMYGAGTGAFNAGTGAFGQGQGFLNTGLQATQLGGQLAQMSAADDLRNLQMRAGAGAEEQAYAQALRDEEVQKFNFWQEEPMRRLQQYWGIVGNNILPGTQTQTTPGPSYNPYAGAAGGALSGAAMGSMVMPGWGTLIGAGLGGVAGALR